MTIHNFQNSLAVGQEVEENFLKLIAELKISFSDKRNCAESRRDGIDFILHFDRDVPLDVKFDEKSVKTGNLAIETVSVATDGVVQRQGWLFTSKSELFVYVQRTPVADVYSFFTKTELSKALVLGEKKEVKNKNYTSEVYVIKRGLLRAPTFTHMHNKEPDLEKLRQVLYKSIGTLSC